MHNLDMSEGAQEEISIRVIEKINSDSLTRTESRNPRCYTPWSPSVITQKGSVSKLPKNLVV